METEEFNDKIEEHPALENFPQELKDRDRWLVWRPEPQDNGKKPKKMPISVVTGKSKDWNTPEMWASYEQAFKYFNKNRGMAGLGFVFTKDDPYTFFDFDNCRDSKTTGIDEKVKKQLKFLDSYTEISQSGEGLKTIIKAKKNLVGTLIDGTEYYDHNKFFAVTGRWVSDYSAAIEDRQEQLDKIEAKYGKETVKANGGNQPGWQDDVVGGVGKNRHINAMKLARRWARLDTTYDEILGRLLQWNQQNKPPFEGSELKELEDCARDAIRYRDKETVDRIPEDYSELIPGGVFKDYIEYTSPFSESPTVFHLYTLSHTISCLIGRDRWIQQGEDIIYPNKYTVVVAPSSLYKKTSAINLNPKFLERVGHRDPYLGQVGSSEGLFNGLIENNGTGFLYYSEFGLLLAQSQKKYLVDAIEILTDLYDCPDYYYKRLSKAAYKIENTFLNMITASQLSSITEHIKESTLLSGFLPRFTVVFSEELRPHLVRRPEPNMSLQNKMLKVLNAIKIKCQVPKRMDLTPEAWDAFEAWGHERYNEARNAPPQIQPMFGRLETHTLKDAIILSMGKNPSNLIVDIDTMEMAFKWAGFNTESYRRLVMEELAFTYEDRKLKKITDIIKNKGKATWRDIVIGTRYKARDLEDLLNTLISMGKIERGKGPKGGKLYKWMC